MLSADLDELLHRFARLTYCFNGFWQIGSGVYFCDVCEGSDSESFLDNIWSSLLAEKHNLRMWNGFANASSGLNTIQIRHSDIQENQIGSQLFSFLNCFQAVGCFSKDLDAGHLL